MDEIIDTLRNELLSSLTALIGDTERLYTGLADKYPALLTEIDRSLKGSDQLIGSIMDSVDSFDSRKARDSVVDRTKTIIDDAHRTFNRLLERGNGLLSDLNSNMERINALETFISMIREDSEEMELISLNAMTVAIKAGKAGGAFSYITEELKRISTRTIDLSEEIIRIGSDVRRIFRGFQNSMAGVENLQKDLFTDFSQKLDKSFETFFQGLKAVVTVLSDIRDRSGGVREPLFGIMHQIQQQDIIRQSIDHVIITLREMKSLNTSDSNEDVLDELSFFQNLPDLCISLLAEVKAKIASSADIFAKNSESIEETIKSVEEDYKRFSSMSGGRDRPFDVAFGEAKSVLEGLASDLKRSLVLKDKVSQESGNLVREVEGMEDTFRAFSTIVGRFHNINIASRIEIAKQSALASMADTVVRMSSLTDSIEENVNGALTSIKDFIKDTAGSVKDYTQMFENEKKFIQSFEADIWGAFSELSAAKSDLEEIISKFSLFSDKFFILFQTTSGDVKDLNTLVSTIERIERTLLSVKEKASSEMNTYLKRAGISEWTIRSTRLKEIIKDFTIFSHKKKAGQIGGFEVEEGVPEGEVTFF